MDLHRLSQEAFETAKAHGWHDTDLPDETYLMLIITEIAEAVQADRKDRHADTARFKECMAAIERTGDDWFMTAFAEHIDGTVECELADIIIRCLDLAALRGISLQYVEEFLANVAKDFTAPFPVIMYRLGWELTSSKETLCEKLNATIAIIIAYCQQKGIEIEWFVEQKMRYNKLRSFKHGNKKY